MKKILKILVTVLLLGVLAYQLRGNISDIFARLAPCARPIPYALGTFDTHFNISKDYFLSALSDAEAIWDEPLGKKLFAYTPLDSDSNVLKLNLIYDYRQQATSKLASLGITVKDTKDSYNMLKAKFTALKTEYDAEKNAFNANVQAFNQKEQTYEDQVSAWNKKGGAPQKEYDQLQATGVELSNQSKQLQNTQISLNAKADEINALVVALNRLVDSLNLSVEKYNTTNQARGESFEEGVYSTDGLQQEIDIYEFSNRAKLVRVLAHELGHALGLDHVSDPKAIMYMLNQGNNETLTKADLDALKAKCGIK